MDITTRAEWGARAPDPRPFPITTWAQRTGFVVHYSAANKNQTVRAIQNYQMDSNGWRDIGYNFLVRHDGTIYEGCQGTWAAIGAHVAGHNTANIGVCAIGTDADITDAHKRSIRALFEEAERRAGKALAMRYHSGMSGASTSCPGNNLRRWVQAGMPVSTEEDDMNAADFAKILDDPQVAARMRALPWQYVGGGIPAGLSTLNVLNAILSKVDISDEELAQIREAAASSVDAIIAGVVAGLQGEIEEADLSKVEDALRRVFADAATA